MCVVWPTPLYFIFLIKIVIWIHFWSVEACTPELVDSHFSLFTSLFRPLSFQPGPSWQASEFDPFGSPAILTPSSEPRVLEGYLKTTANRGPEGALWIWTPGDYPLSLAYIPWYVWLQRKAWVCVCRCGACGHWRKTEGDAFIQMVLTQRNLKKKEISVFFDISV